MKNLLIVSLVGLTLLSCGSATEETDELSVDLIDNPNTAAEDGSTDENDLPYFEFVEKVKELGKSKRFAPATFLSVFL